MVKGEYVESRLVFSVRLKLGITRFQVQRPMFYPGDHDSCARLGRSQIFLCCFHKIARIACALFRVGGDYMETRLYHSARLHPLVLQWTTWKAHDKFLIFFPPSLQATLHILRAKRLATIKKTSQKRINLSGGFLDVVDF